MAGNDPWSGARFPTTGDAASIAQYFQNEDADLSDIAIPTFSSTSARDAALTARTNAGRPANDGLHCFVVGLGNQTLIQGTWVNDAWTNLSLTSPWSAYVGSGTSSVGTGPYDGPGARRIDAYKGQLRGWVTTSTTVGANSGILATVLPAFLRPSKPRSLMVPWETTGGAQTGVTRFEVYTDGQIYSIRGVGIANTYMLLDNLLYDL